ncbi:MAG: shikimate dehydrogenase [Roseiarcus sp.]|jgi:shikimate 5-dehydrogenase|uniref:shikimate dehydrogenase family protein n=1 Tax=Roseiarcus sp. TaxID=1969460 RepID=UPI003C24D210
MTGYSAATAPTLFFFGVTTAKSSIMKVFPAWAKRLGLKDAVIKGIDFPLHAPAADYRAAVAFVKRDPLALGALVTTHKIDLYNACRDQFDEIDAHARFMGETSCLSKRVGKFVCHAKDPISSGLALDGFLPARHFERTGAELFSMGAGGSSIALTWHMMQTNRGVDRPSRIVVSNRSAARLEEIQRIHRELDAGVPVDYVLAPKDVDNDAVVAKLKPGSLVVNATGLGKDAPGSPASNAVQFPENGIVWDLNYRGDLLFLNQAHAQASLRGLSIEDGWSYFLHGWTQVIAEVFHIDIPTSGPVFDALSEIAMRAVKG